MTCATENTPARTLDVTFKAGGVNSITVPPNGHAAASLMAAGLGSAALGIAIVLTEMSPGVVKKWLNLYDPVGPLSGKTTVAVVVFLVSWIILAAWVGRRDVNFPRWAAIAFALLGVGLLLTFPPIFTAFAPAH
jgi:hypothetical protein